MNRIIGIIIVVAVVLGLGGVGLAWYMRRDGSATLYQTTKVRRGDLQATIGATGTVEPEELVDVGAQIQGQIDRFGTDESGKPVDFNSVVGSGMLLAHIDDSLYKADVESATAAVDSAKANVQKSQADLEQMKAKLGQAQADWERAQAIGQQSEALSKTTYDSYRFGFETAKANVSVADASLQQAKTSVTQAEATLSRAQKNLGYCTINSPVSGTIISRRVNIGQTVVASLNAPSLFLIAKDLTRMVVWASVNEADIGNIHAGQTATFTVDAFPSHTFTGKVSRVRMDAQMTSNVVTYIAEVEVNNTDKTLRPYLTANVQFQVAKHENALLVPNAALRWSPASLEAVSPASRNELSNGGGGESAAEGSPASGGSTTRRAESASGDGASTGGNAPPTTRPSASAGAGRERRKGGSGGGGEHHHGTVWVQDGKYVKPIRVRLGLTDGIDTEVQGDGLQQDMPVVIGEIRPEDAGTGEARNPFAPNFHSGRHGH